MIGEQMTKDLCDRCDTGFVTKQCQSAAQHDSDYTFSPTTSRRLDHYHSQPSGHSDVQPTDRRSTHSDITSLGTDATATAQTTTTSCLSAVIDLLDEAPPLFYTALTSGATFAACVWSPSCVVAIVAVTSFVSFAFGSARRSVITPVLHQMR